MPATPSPRPAFAAEELPWGLLLSARAQGDAQALESLWAEFKRPEQARASAVRAIFQGACARGDIELAAWVHGLHPQHVDAKLLKDTAAHAIRQRAMPAWDFLTGIIDAHHGAGNIYRGLMRDAVAEGNPAILQKIWPQAGAEPSSHLYAAVIGDNMPALTWLTEACKNAGQLTAADVNKAFLLAVQRAQTPMVAWLLGAGAEASTHDNAALRQAVPHSAADGGVLMDILVRAGAHPQKALDLLAQHTDTRALLPKIKQAAEETAQHHMDVLDHVCGRPLQAGAFCADQASLGMTGLQYAAYHRILDRIAVQRFTSEALAKPNAQGHHAVQVLADRGALDTFFVPDRWRGQTEKLAAALDLVPAGLWSDEKRAQILRSAEQQSLQHLAASAAGAFRLGRKSSP